MRAFLEECSRVCLSVLIKLIWVEVFQCSVEQQSSAFLASGLGFVEDNVSTDQGRGSVLGRFKCITLTVYFISVIITSAPAQIIRHQIPEVGDPYCRMNMMGTVIRELGLKICVCHLPFLWCGGSFWAYLVLSFPHLAVGDVQGGMDWDTHFPPGGVPWRYRGYLLDSPGESSIIFSNNFLTTEKTF